MWRRQLFARTKQLVLHGCGCPHRWGGLAYEMLSSSHVAEGFELAPVVLSQRYNMLFGRR